MNTALSLTHKIGQKMMIGFPGTTLDESIIHLIKTYKISNIVLFSSNIESKDQLARLCADIQALVRKETGFDALISIDQEGGVVSRLSEDTTRIPGAMAIAATGDVQNAYTAGRITGSELKALGVNFDLAPVMDVNSNPHNPVIGVRSYGDTPETVSEYAISMMKGLLDGGVLCAAKHFPGHGDTSVDSHLALPTVDKPASELWKNELLPFRAAIQAGIPGIMSSHILFPQLESKNIPATMSRTILTDLLKKQMGFKGLVLTDCLEMRAIKEVYTTEKGAVEAVKAGADLILISHTASVAEWVAKAIHSAVLAGEIDMQEMDESVAKILSYKADYANKPGVPSVIGCEEHQAENAKIMQATLTAVHLPQGELPDLGERPHFLGCLAYRSTIASSQADQAFSFPRYMADKLGGSAAITPLDPTAEEISAIRDSIGDATCLVIGTYNGHLNRGQLDLVNELCKTQIPTIAIALRNPYDLQHLDNRVTKLAGYEYTQLCFDALAKVLQKQALPTGKLSVQL